MTETTKNVFATAYSKLTVQICNSDSKMLQDIFIPDMPRLKRQI